MFFAVDWNDRASVMRLVERMRGKSVLLTSGGTTEPVRGSAVLSHYADMVGHVDQHGVEFSKMDDGVDPHGERLLLATSLEVYRAVRRDFPDVNLTVSPEFERGSVLIRANWLATELTIAEILAGEYMSIVKNTVERLIFLEQQFKERFALSCAMFDRTRIAAIDKIKQTLDGFEAAGADPTAAMAAVAAKKEDLQ